VNTKKIISIAGGLILLVFVAVFFFVYSGIPDGGVSPSPSPKLPDTFGPPPQLPPPPVSLPQPSDVQPPPAAITGPPPTTGRITNQQLREETSFNRELIEILNTFEAIEKLPDIVVPPPPPPSPSPPTVPTDDDERVREFALHPEYRRSVEEVEKTLAKVGFITEDEMITDLTSVENIQVQQHRFIDFLASRPEDKYFYNNPANVASAHASIDKDIPKAVLARADYFRSLTRAKQDRVLAGLPPEKESLFARAVNFFSPESADAQIYGVWDSITFCYKTISVGILPGVAIPWYNCNSGWFIAGYVETYYYDCLPYSVLCNLPLGCLNLVCYTKQNALADIPTGTYMCGC
jgi:hypothetical protein